jgi:hypothetical protein
MIAENHSTGWQKFQRIITLASAIFGMITPFAIFYLGYIITNADEQRRTENQKFDVLMRIGPTLFENDLKKILFALQIMDDAGLDKRLVRPSC